MNDYTIYWIKEEFARFFYYRSDVLYRFMKDYESNRNRTDLAMQFQYITMNLPMDLMIARIVKHQRSHTGISMNANFVEVFDDTRYISLHINEKHINFRGDIIHDAEDLLFPVLRSFQPYFFVAGNDAYNSGWISPIRQGKDNGRTGQVLYSCP